ncbi:MAG: uroporphyrinogen-III synthase [Gammaproteobacteria bacterium]|nr:uroporphyrinogen-III synthase [Gammaproteobacteria bacterium]
MPSDGATDGQALVGCRILVTRPHHQAGALCSLIEQAGGIAIRLPAIEIIAAPMSPALLQTLQQLSQFDVAIFISANAVYYGGQLLARLGGWPRQLQYAAVGQKTATAMQGQGITPDIVPAAFSSEALLADPRLQAMQGRRVVIFRGGGGRELLGDVLRARGAHVEYVEVYDRRCPASDLVPVRNAGIDAIVVTSNEGLDNLYTMAGDHHRQWLLAQTLALISERGAQHARSLGFRGSLLPAHEASDPGLLAVLSGWWSTRPTRPAGPHFGANSKASE